MTDKPSTFDLNKYTFKLLQADPFFASLSRRIQKRSSTAIPTAGVRLNKDTAQFEMLYNPQFFEDMTDKERLGVLKHEFYHIIFEHVTGRLPPEGMSQIAIFKEVPEGLKPIQIGPAVNGTTPNSPVVDP